jgi:hypothetical protein
MAYAPSFWQPGHPLMRIRGFASLDYSRFAFYREVCGETVCQIIKQFKYQIPFMLYIASIIQYM